MGKGRQGSAAGDDEAYGNHVTQLLLVRAPSVRVAFHQCFFARLPNPHSKPQLFRIPSTKRGVTTCNLGMKEYGVVQGDVWATDCTFTAAPPISV